MPPMQGGTFRTRSGPCLPRMRIAGQPRFEPVGPSTDSLALSIRLRRDAGSWRVTFNIFTRIVPGRDNARSMRLIQVSQRSRRRAQRRVALKTRSPRNPVPAVRKRRQCTCSLSEHCRTSPDPDGERIAPHTVRPRRTRQSRIAHLPDASRTLRQSVAQPSPATHPWRDS